MFVDNENQFTTGGTAGQSLSGFNVGTTAVGNVIDSGPVGGQNTPNTNAGRDWGMGYTTWLYFLFVSIPVGVGATVDIQLVSSAAAALTSPNVMLDLTGGALAITSSKVATGAAFRVALPRAGIGGTTGRTRSKIERAFDARHNPAHHDCRSNRLRYLLASVPPGEHLVCSLERVRRGSELLRLC